MENIMLVTSAGLLIHLVLAELFFRQVPRRNMGVVAYLNNYVHSVPCNWNG